MDLTTDFWTYVMGASLAVQLLGEYVLHVRPLAASAKTLCAFSFLAIAHLQDAQETEFGRRIFAALLLSFVGDVALIGRTPAWFALGLVSFLLGHIGFIFAFASRGIDPACCLLTFVFVAPISYLIGGWVVRIAKPDDMKPKVTAYIVVITIMVAAAGGTRSSWLLVAAIMFFLSDLCVAVDRFVTRQFMVQAAGLPLYFGAQWMFAMHVATG